MTTQPKKPSIRKARRPGPHTKAKPHVQQPRDPDGEPAPRPPSYEELSEKVSRYEKAFTTLYDALEGGEVAAAKQLIVNLLRGKTR